MKISAVCDVCGAEFYVKGAEDEWECNDGPVYVCKGCRDDLMLRAVM